MKKFVFLYYGSQESTPEVMDAWNKWFTKVADKLVDSGNPFGPGKEITHSGTKELPQGNESVVGYSIINAENMGEAEEIAKSCPMVTSVRVYEAMAM